MFKIEFFIDEKIYNKNFTDLNNLQKFVDGLKKNSISIDYNKCWVYSNNDLKYLVNTEKFIITDVSKLTFSDIDDFSLGKNYVNNHSIIDYYKFIVASWGHVMYLEYGNFDKGKDSDVKRFFNKFNHSEILNLNNNIIYSEDIYDCDDAEWIQGGMSMDGTRYLNKTVVDNLLGLCFKPITEPLVIYKTWGAYSGKRRSETYKGWLSTSTEGTPYISNDNDDEYDDDNVDFERFVLPIGFPICRTLINGESLADDDEIIVRNEDLVKL